MRRDSDSSLSGLCGHPFLGRRCAQFGRDLTDLLGNAKGKKNVIIVVYY